jgi:hypothetical protein
VLGALIKTTYTISLVIIPLICGGIPVKAILTSTLLALFHCAPNQPAKLFNVDGLRTLLAWRLKCPQPLLTGCVAVSSPEPEDQERGMSQFDLDRWADDGGPTFDRD